jgi:hypothetical protein
VGAKADAPCGALNGQQSEDLASYRDEYRDLRWDTRGGHDRAGDPAAAAGQLLPAIAAGTVGPARAGLDLGCGGVVPAAETLALPVREGGRIVLVGGLIATGVCAGGSNSLGLMSPARRTAQDGGRFFLSLVARGLSGVAMVTSDAHAGLVAAIATAGPPVLKLWRVSIGGNGQVLRRRHSGHHHPQRYPSPAATHDRVQPVKEFGVCRTLKMARLDDVEFRDVEISCRSFSSRAGPRELWRTITGPLLQQLHRYITPAMLAHA